LFQLRLFSSSRSPRLSWPPRRAGKLVMHREVALIQIKDRRSFFEAQARPTTMSASNRPFGVKQLSDYRPPQCRCLSRARASLRNRRHGPSIMGSEDEAEQSVSRPYRQKNGRSRRTCELTSSIVPRSFHCSWISSFSPIGVRSGAGVRSVFDLQCPNSMITSVLSRRISI